MDHIISELDNRFDLESSAVIVEFMQLLPSVLCNKSSLVKLTRSDFAKVLDLYEEDLSSPRSLDVELDLWHTKWVGSEAELAENLNTAAKALPHADQDYFPNIRTLILIMTTLPVTSCECERSISLLRLVKSTLRTTMTEDRLNGLALMQYHHDIPLDPAQVVEEFARCHPRRFRL